MLCPFRWALPSIWTVPPPPLLLAAPAAANTLGDAGSCTRRSPAFHHVRIGLAALPWRGRLPFCCWTPIARSLLGISNDVAMQVVGVGFIIGVIQIP